MVKLSFSVRTLGAKIISLKYGQIELLYLPASAQPLPKPGAEFDPRFAWGVDICAPGVAAEPGVADHGNFWTKEFVKSNDSYTADDGRFRLTVRFEANENKLIRAYSVANLTGSNQPFTFADHFLMPVAPAHTEPWSQKSFLRSNSFTYDHPAGLKLNFTSPELDWVGLWRTEGGWNNQFNTGIELTNANNDSLSQAIKNNTGWQIQPHTTKNWSIILTVQP